MAIVASVLRQFQSLDIQLQTASYGEHFYQAVRNWRTVATKCHIPPAEQQRFAKRFEYCS